MPPAPSDDFEFELKDTLIENAAAVCATLSFVAALSFAHYGQLNEEHFKQEAEKDYLHAQFTAAHNQEKSAEHNMTDRLCLTLSIDEAALDRFTEEKQQEEIRKYDNYGQMALGVGALFVFFSYRAHQRQRQRKAQSPKPRSAGLLAFIS